MRDDERTIFDADPFKALEEIIGGLATKGSHKKNNDPPFKGGAVGYFSYELKDVIEGSFSSRTPRSSDRNHGDDAPPLSSFAFYDPIYVYDHKLGRGRLVTAGTEGAEERANIMERSLASACPATLPSPTRPCGRWTADFTRSEYIEAVIKAKEYIAAGDIYQINLSQRLTVPWDGDPVTLYGALAESSPAPFSSFIDCGDVRIVSNSPERLMLINGDHIETSPIKGTRPRGRTEAEDRAMIDELRGSVKERAEHVMIVDLERNDLGRVCRPGTVRVRDFERIETFPGLHHMVSTIEGRLRPEVSALAALREAFPGGSITGAPKIRAMEIIEELEGGPRGVYTGAIGYLDLSGDMDMSLAIRTATLTVGELALPVGGGIVADSDPSDEYDETLLKAEAFLDLLESGETGAMRAPGRMGQP